jgi:hypothetical protein
MSMESHGGMISTGETEELGENPVPVPLSATDATWTDPAFRGERPAANRLSQGTACQPAFIELAYLEAIDAGSRRHVMNIRCAIPPARLLRANAAAL